jgi:hypothetical protein
VCLSEDLDVEAADGLGVNSVLRKEKRRKGNVDAPLQPLVRTVHPPEVTLEYR